MVRPRLVVGLGNPGRDYVGTRHNVGFAVLDRLATEHGSSFKGKARLAVELAELTGPAGKIVLAKPQTFMNRSGAAVAAIVHWLKVTPAETLVVVDDADLPLGELRLRASGGAGGHNGLRSIVEALGGNELFPRVRIGIGGGGQGADLAGHVLSRFGSAEQAAVDEALADAAAAVVCCWEKGLTAAMNQFNRKRKPEE